MGKLRFIHSMLSAIFHLFASRHRFFNKIRVFFIFLRLTFKRVFLNPFFKFKTERFLGFKISFFDYRQIYFIFREIFVYNQYLVALKKKKPVILDCGANIGLAILFFKWLYPHCEIHAFEPDPATFKILEENVRQNRLKDVHLYNSAVMDKDRKIDFFISKTMQGDGTMSAVFGKNDKEKIIVDAVQLSAFIKDKRIDLMKMDIEGVETVVIKDLAEKGVLKNIAEIIMEYHNKAGERSSEFKKFLSLFKKEGFEYQFSAECLPIRPSDEFQNILIHFYNN